MKFKRTFNCLYAVGLTLAASISAHGADFFPASGSDAIKDQYIVVYKTPEMTTQSSEQFTQSVTADIQSVIQTQVLATYSEVLNGAVVKANATQLQYILSRSDVAYVEQDKTISISPIFSAQQANPTWGLDRIDQRNLPLDNQYNVDDDGNVVTAYIIDTGILNSHNEFGGRSKSGYDFVDNDSNANDCNGHGTHVAGTVGGSVYGVAKKVRLVGVRVLNCNGSGSVSGVVSGINWVANAGKNDGGPSVANMSLGGGTSTSINNAVNSAVDQGIFFAVAAGNENTDACNRSPASAANAYTVASTTVSDNRSGFSNYGRCVDIFAPGSNITSAWIGNNGATRTISGTSMATPHVAGVAALYYDKKPSLSTTDLAKLLDDSSTKNVVKDPRTGSPNQLVYAKSKGSNGLTKVVSGAANSAQNFSLKIPAGTKTIVATLGGGSGDPDLYVRRGVTPLPFDFDCASENVGSDERCIIKNPKAGTWYFQVYGYTSFKNVTLKVEY